ncbi:MAG: aminotransferase class I/II-fold pyridoxal phosphate-dependent enzyme [Myxococcota bacterium]
MKLETLAVHAGRRPDPATGAVTPPIHLSTTFQRAADGSYPLGFSYSREDNPNRRALEECLAALEGGTEALAFSSGQAVSMAVLQALEPGDHIIAPQDVYYGLRKLLGEVLRRWQLDVSYVDMTDADAVRAAVRRETRLLWVETPSNPLLRITDLATLATLAREIEAICICDSTFASPMLQRPLELGVDLMMHSTTKYLSGHSDVMGGVLITNHANYVFERARASQKFGGAVPSPFDCWLTLRGVDTLAVRMRAASENALKVARFLSGHANVEAVHYPGLETHPGHETARRQMRSFGGMLSMQVRGCGEKTLGVAARVKLFTRATSLGGAHSLIEHRASIEGPDTRTPQNLLRMSIGLEDAEDLIADLDQALAGV